MEELFATEKSFVRVLELICKNFYHTLRELISLEDCRLMFDTAQVRMWGRGRYSEGKCIVFHNFLPGTTSSYPFCSSSLSSCQLLYPVHCSLLEDLEKTMDQKHDSGRSDVTQYFLSHHTGLLHYGQYAVRLPQAVEKVGHSATEQATQLQPLIPSRPRCFRIAGRQRESFRCASRPRSRGSLSVTSCTCPSRGSSNTLSS